MTRTQLILVLGAAALVVVLFQLPRSVVENEQLQEVTQTESHSMEIPQEVETQINELRRLVEEEGNIDKKANFAHSLARRYLDYGIVDSAARYAERIHGWSEGPSELAADIYFTAYERSQGPDQAKEYALKAREVLQNLLDKDPDNLVVKNRLAMTMVVSENPMAGINMLREILVVDETNRQAILNLGLLAIQSGQFDRARERFEKLVSLNPADHEAKLYLAVSLMEINQQSQARLLLEEILATQDSIPAVKVMAGDYLNSL
ncbi:tetratricopeptide repeat protein [Ekhidna sp.]|uniref:tetratricopeptide repeat protein n=1 Tax=Ekhidna sp. TaxID=2608089 RepID=UPI003CCBD7CD